jgi:plasmid maintenance system antidote protein VapI
VKAKAKTKARVLPPLDQQLRALLIGEDQTPGELSRRSGVDERVIRRFLASERDVTLATAGRIAAPLGLELTIRRGAVKAKSS